MAAQKGRDMVKRVDKWGFYKTIRSLSDSPRRENTQKLELNRRTEKLKSKKKVVSVSPSHDKEDSNKKFYHKALKKYFKAREGLFPSFNHLSEHELEALYYEMMAKENKSEKWATSASSMSPQRSRSRSVNKSFRNTPLRVHTHNDESIMNYQG
jgi:hypothetical protein